MNDQEIKNRYYAFERQGKREEGIAFLEEYIQKADGEVSAELLAHTGNVILLYLGELEKGVGYFRRAIEKEPDNPDVYWTYFTDLEEITDKYPAMIDDAVLCLTKLIEYIRRFKPGRAGLKRAGKQYRYDESLLDAGKRTMNLAGRYNDLAVMYMKIPDYEKAQECVDQSLALQPGDDYAAQIKSEILAATGKEQEADPLEKAASGEEADAEKTIRPDETITHPLLRLADLVEKISGCYHSVPAETLAELNRLTGNEWAEGEYIEFCAEYWSRSTLEETVYALLHGGEYPDSAAERRAVRRLKRKMTLLRLLRVGKRT